MANATSWVLNFLQWPFRGRQQRLMRERAAYSKEVFIGFFVARGVSLEIADEAWTILVKTAVIEGFKPRPEDDLEGVFGLADEDLDEDVVLELLRRCNCRIPRPAEVEGMEPVKTVANLVEFVWQMKASKPDPEEQQGVGGR